MVDFSKRILNSDKFRQAAIRFQGSGFYCSAPIGSSEYLEYWDEESARCLDGYTAEDGDWISGYNYFYLNYCPILRIVHEEITDRYGTVKKVRKKVSEFPDFYDYDYYFFMAVQAAQDQGKHLSVLKSRRKGYSFKLGAMMDRNYYLIPSSKSFAFAAENEFLIKDGIITKAWEYMDFIDANTAWVKKRQKTDTKMHRRASVIMKDASGNIIEEGYKSEIIGVTAKNDVNKIRGKSGQLIVIEEGGKFPNLLELWQIARPSVEQDGIAHGTMIVFGTGGSDGDDFTGLKELFYHPKGHNCLELDNIWDEGGHGSKCGFFIPQYTNLDVRDENGVRVYMDEDGNTYTDKARDYVLSLRNDVIEHATDARAIDRYVAEQPCLDGDTMISTEDGISIIKNNPKAWCSGVKDIYRIEMNDGAELNLTMNHRLFDGDKYKELSEFNVGDELFYKPTIFSKEYQPIIIPGLIKASDFNLVIDEQWGLFIGLFMGDGYYYGKSGELGIVFDKQDAESIDWAYSFMEKNFGDTRKKVTGKLGGGIVVRTVSKKMLDVVEALDLVRTRNDGSRIRNVHVPYYIFNSPEPVVANFLRGMFDSDGHAVASGRSVGFMSKYRQVSKDIQFLLRGFGIHSKWSHRIVVNSSGYEYEENKISIRSGQISLFRDGIGFLSKRKNDKIASYAPSRKGRDYSRDKIKSIEFYKRDKVYDITTDDSTLSASGINAHNCTPQEACLELTGNIFPKKELSMQLSSIRVNKKLQNHKQVGDLVWVNGLLSWQIKKHGDITKYPLGKDDDPTGSIVIWEHPDKDPPSGLYIAGNDPYDFDKAATSTSLGSTIIYKRFQAYEGYYDVIVAEYTGRPSTANEHYENVLKLLTYYNAKLLYENEKRGLFTYFAHQHKEYMLADQPDIISDIIGRSTVQRRKGIHMTKEIIKYSEILIKDWLNEEYAPGHKNVERILSEPLLEELISYNDKGNFDRVRALQCVFIYREQLYHQTVKQVKEETKKDLFESPLFYRKDEQADYVKGSKSIIKF